MVTTLGNGFGHGHYHDHNHVHGNDHMGHGRGPFDHVPICCWQTCVRFSTFQYFLAAFDILNKSGDTLTVKELSLLFGKEETADALVMENFIRKIIKDHNDQTEVSFDEFKMLVSKNNEFRGIQTAFEVRIFGSVRRPLI